MRPIGRMKNHLFLNTDFVDEGWVHMREMMITPSINAKKIPEAHKPSQVR